MKAKRFKACRTEEEKIRHEKSKVERLHQMVARCKYKDGEIDEAKRIAVDLMENSTDPRVRANMVKLLLDINLEVARFELDIQKYEEPPKQKIEHSGDSKIVIKLDNIDV